MQQEIKINPQDAELHARLATYFSAISDRRLALAEVDRALKLDPASASVLYDAALVHEDLHNREAALKAIETLLNTGQKKAEILASPVLEQLRKDPRFARVAGPRP